jgi:hypothetical protein
MLKHVVKPESSRARRRRLGRSKAKKLALMAAIPATAVAVGLTPTLANAASTQTYYVGFPDWLGIGAGATLPSDPVAINNAIVAAKDGKPLVAWGLGDVDLRPVWLNWYNPVNPLDPTDPDQDQYYTTPEIGQTGTQTVTVNEPNPLYQPAYDAAYDAGYEVGRAEYLANVYQDTYDAVYAQVRDQKYQEYITQNCRRPLCNPTNPPSFVKQLAEAAAAVAAAAAAVDAAQAAGNTPEAAAAADAAGQASGLAAALAAVTNIPQTIEFSQEIPIFGVVRDGYWTTTTSGQWVASPGDVAALPTAGQLAYLAYAVEHGDLSALAPLLNWTAYLTNVNLIAYGDGAIATGVAYQAFIDSVKGNTQAGYNPFALGDPQTGPRKIRITFGDGVATITQTDTTNNPLEVPLPDDLEFPDAPQVGWESVQDGGVIDMTLLSLVLARNPGRANGGLYARFAPIYEELTGVNPVTPDRQDVLPEGFDPDVITKLLTGNAGDITIDELGNLQAVMESVDGKPIVVTLKADVGWEYDLMSDAPVTANPFAWANSIASAVFLNNLLTGVDFENLGEGGYVGPDGTIYYTLTVDDLPLLAPLRLPAQLLGLATGNLDINTPLADALEPALRILVDIGYNDVVRNPDGTYTRTLDKFGENALFGSQTLTREQMALVPGDLIAALGAGFGDELSDVLIRGKDQLTHRLKITLTAEQDAALEQALSAPGGLIKTAGRAVGDRVSQVVSAVEAELPEERPAPTQQELAERQHQVGETLAKVAQQIRTADDGADEAGQPQESQQALSASTDSEKPQKHAKSDDGPRLSVKRNIAHKFSPGSKASADRDKASDHDAAATASTEAVSSNDDATKAEPSGADKDKDGSDSGSSSDNAA